MKMKYDITFHPEWWYKNSSINFSKEFFDDPTTRIESDKVMRRALFYKFGKFGFGEEDPEPRPILGTNLLAAGYLHSEVLGCHIEYAKDNSPVVVPLNMDPDDIETHFVYNGLTDSAIWQRVEKQITFLLKEYGFVESYINLMGVQNIAMDILGQELFMEYLTNPENLQRLFRGITDCLLDIGKRLKEISNNISEGVTSIIGKSFPEAYLTSNCSCEMISNATYEEFLLPYDVELAEAFGSFGIHHCGASMEHVIKGYSKVPNLDFLEVGAGSDVQKVREQFPNTFLNLRVSPVDLNNMSAVDLEGHINQLVEYGRNTENKVSVSCVGIDHSVSTEKILSLLSICDKIEF